jgi:hypothetical protein
METINTSAKTGELRVRLNVSTRVPTEVTAFCSDRWINAFEIKVEVGDDLLTILNNINVKKVLKFVDFFVELLTRVLM